MKLREIRLSTRITVSAMIIVAAGAMLLAYVENARLRDVYLSEQKTRLELDLEASALQLHQTISTLHQDVLFLSNTPPVSGIVRAALNKGYDPHYGNTHQIWAERLQQIFSAFSIAHPDYYKIRFIGLADGGREIVRIYNRGGSRIEVAPRDKLQTKGDSDYFKATLGLHQGEVYLSEFNLDHEHGVIAQPYQPALRAATPVFDPSGKMFGMLVISMDADSLLKPAIADMPGILTYMANADEQYLLHPDSQKAFKFELGSKDKITADFPFIKTMFDVRAPDYLPLQAAATNPDSPLFSARQIHFDPSDPSRLLLLMYFLPEAAAAKQIATIPAQHIGGGLIVLLLTGVIVLIALRRTFSPLEKIAAAADNIAAGKHDMLLPKYSGGEIGSLTNALNTMLTQLSQRGNSLLESEARYRRLHESMMDAFSIADMSGRFIESNYAFQEMLGYSAEELQRLTCVDLTPEKWHGFEANILNEQVIPHGQSPVYEMEYIRKDGTVFPVELRTFLLRDANNQPEAMWAIVRDITERTRAEEALQQGANRIWMLLNSVAEGIYGVDMEGNCTFINSAGLHLLGYQEETELIGKHMHTLIHHTRADGSYYPASECRLYGCLQSHENVHVDDELFWRKDGSSFPVDYWSRPIKLIGEDSAVVTFLDITERKQAVEQLQKSAGEISDLYNHAPCGYHSLDKDGNIRLMNDTELSWLGYTRDEVIGKIKWPDLLAPASLPTFREGFPQLMRQGFARDIEIEMIRKDGTTFTGLLNASAIYDSDGNFVMSRSTVIDITARKLAERLLQELSAHLQTIREEEKSNIAREIHDELGGTLTALKMEAYRLASELTANKAAAPLMTRVNSMSNLLDGAVVATRSIITELRPTILDDLGLLAALEWQAGQFHKHTGISCRVNCVEDTCKLDKHFSIALFRIFQEALTNAARHSGASRIEVEFQCGKEEVSLSISDNGHGLPEVHTVAPTSYGMRGMSERVEQLGGKIKFNSPPGGGFNVTVVLPMQVKSIKEKRHDPYHDRRRPRHSTQWIETNPGG